MSRVGRPGPGRSRAVRVVWLLLAVLVGVLGFRAVLAGSLLGEAAETAELTPPIEQTQGTLVAYRSVAGVELAELAVTVRGGAERTVLLPAPVAEPAVGDVVELELSTTGEQTVAFANPTVRVDVAGRTDPPRRAAIVTRAEQLYWGGLLVTLLAALGAVLAIDRALR